MPPLPDPIPHSRFALNALEFVGLVGGTEIISAMSLIPLYQGSRWLRWYNSPGSFDIARFLGKLVTALSSRPGQAFARRTETPAVLFGYDGEVGPRFMSATFPEMEAIQTGHLGYLVMEKCKAMMEVTDIDGRRTVHTDVAVIKLDHPDYDHSIPRLSLAAFLYAIIPILSSSGCCIMCTLVGDYYIASVIAIGILTTGLVGIAIGSGRLCLRSVTRPPPGTPPVHGLLLPSFGEDLMVVVQGPWAAVNAIQKGAFVLHLNPISRHCIAFCSLLFVAECLAQLILIPQGTLFGQVMFISSLAVSWTYSYYLSSFKKEQLQADLLFARLGNPKLRKFRAGTRTTMVTLLAILLFDGIDKPPENAVKKVMRAVLPNDTPVWEIWREKVTLQICDRMSSSLQMDEDAIGLADDQRKLLQLLLDDSKRAFAGFSEHCSDI